MSEIHIRERPRLLALVDYPDPYVQPLIIDALKRHMIGFSVEFALPQQNLSHTAERLLQIAAYEELDFEQALSHQSSYLINSYVIRKALIRKHYLSNTIETWIIKHPESILRKHFRTGLNFELDYAEFLDDALLEAYELHQAFENNAEKRSAEREWWILKPGMSDGGNGIRLFSTFGELQAIFDEWEPASEDEEEELEADRDDHDHDHDHDAASATSQNLATGDRPGAITSQLRHFIAQPYIHPPLILPSKGRRKFHIRVYVLAKGCLQVYVYREALALFAAKQYVAPGREEEIDLSSHLTNTCFQDESTKDTSVYRFWSLEDESLEDPKWKDHVYQQICQVTGEVFEAAARGQMVHFQPLPNAFEIFGVDFLVDDTLNVWLLELNAFPDFKQTGTDLQDEVVGGLFNETIRTAVKPFFSIVDEAIDKSSDSDRMRLVRDLDLGVR